MGEPSFKKVAQLTRESATIARQNEEIVANQLKEIQENQNNLIKNYRIFLLEAHQSF